MSGGVNADRGACARMHRRSELERLTAIQATVRVVNPAYPSEGWTGRIVGLADQPSVILDCADGKRRVLPQAFEVREIPEAGPEAVASKAQEAGDA
jgi:hypothetical protein